MSPVMGPEFGPIFGWMSPADVVALQARLDEALAAEADALGQAGLLRSALAERDVTLQHVAALAAVGTPAITKTALRAALGPYAPT